MGKKNKLKFDWDFDSYDADTAGEDYLPLPDTEDSEEDWDYDPYSLEEDCIANTDYADDEEYDDNDEDDFILQCQSPLFIQDDDSEEEDENETDNANLDMQLRGYDPQENDFVKETTADDEDDDEDDFVLQGQRPLSFDNDDSEEEEDDETDNIDFALQMLGYAPHAEKKQPDVAWQPSENPVISAPFPIAETQAAPANPPSTVSLKKETGHRQTLQDMQNAIVSRVPLITYNGGLYFYNGRTYKALGSSYELLELVRSKVSSTAFSSTTTKQFYDLLVYLKADDRLEPVHYQDRLIESKNKVVLNNGVLDLITMRLHPHSSRYLTFHQLDADYVEKKPKAFLRFLDQVSGGDAEIALRIAEVVGYLLSSLNHRYFFVAGTAQGSGKSTLGLLLQALIGPEQVSSISTYQLDRRFALGSTRNKMLNLAMDVPKGHLSSVAVSLIKTITGGDPIEIEEKYQPTERIISNLRFLFGTNYPITVSESDNEIAFWGRMVLLPFTRSVPPHLADLTLLDKLIEEKDKIISYCLRALSGVIANNMQFSPCAVADQMKAEWRNAAIDPRSWEEFWYTHVSVTGESEDSVFAMELYDRYKAFCWEKQCDPIPYLNMKNWIAANVSTDDCIPKRIHRTGENPRAGYIGIRMVEPS